jgi:hypothetical protein
MTIKQLLYVFFWVFPRRPILVCRRFGTLYQFQLQGMEDGTDRGFRNVDKPQSDAGEIPKRIHTSLLVFAFFYTGN